MNNELYHKLLWGEELEEQRYETLGQPEETAGPYSSSDCTQPRRGNQMPKSSKVFSSRISRSKLPSGNRGPSPKPT